MSHSTVLITGASTGIGKAVALCLDRVGFQVFAGVRKPEDGEALRRESEGQLVPVILDVTEGESIRRAADLVREVTGGVLHGLVNNAGIAIRGPLEFMPISDFRRQLEVNLIGHLAVTQAFLPLLRKGRGRIVFIGSITGRLAPPFLGVYSASKAALEVMADTLRIELRPWGVQVSVLICGSVKTLIWERGKVLAEKIDQAMPPEGHDLYAHAAAMADRVYERVGKSGMPPQRVARVVASALTTLRPRPRYIVGQDAKCYGLLLTLLPTRLRDWLMARKAGIS